MIMAWFSPSENGLALTRLPKKASPHTINEICNVWGKSKSSEYAIRLLYHHIVADMIPAKLQIDYHNRFYELCDGNMGNSTYVCDPITTSKSIANEHAQLEYASAGRCWSSWTFLDDVLVLHWPILRCFIAG